VKVADNNELTPFATVTYFDIDKEGSLTSVSDLSGLKFVPVVTVPF